MDRVQFTSCRLTRETPFAVWVERVTSILRTKDLGQWLQRVPLTAADRELSEKARSYVVLSISDELVPLIAGVPFCNDVIRVLRTECDGTVQLQAVQIEVDIYQLKQNTSETLMAYCERARELLRKMEILQFADRDRRIVTALIRGLKHEVRMTMAGKFAERPNQTFIEVINFCGNTPFSQETERSRRLSMRYWDKPARAEETGRRRNSMRGATRSS